MSLGVEFRCSGDSFWLMCDGHQVSENDIVVPPAVIDILYIGGARLGSMMVVDSSTNPGEWVVVKPYNQEGRQLRNEIVELGTMVKLEAFANIELRCISYIPD